jgi:3-hydroxybutyryl-CoA dehydrogenase
MEIRKLGVVGAGIMGSGIAQLAAQIGCDVVMRDIEDAFVERGLKGINKFLSKSVEKGKLKAEEKEAIVGRIKGTTAMSDLRWCSHPIPLPCLLRRSPQPPKGPTRSAGCISSIPCH